MSQLKTTGDALEIDDKILEVGLLQVTSISIT